MTAYVALVAIGNVLVGMMLARILPPSAICPQYFSPRSRARRMRPERKPEPTVRTVEMPQSSATREELADRDQPDSADKSIEEERKPRHAAPDFVKSWADFAQQLRDVKDRTRYCRPAQDMKLARQAAEQLRTCAQVWYAQFEPCLSNGELDDATKALVAGAEIGDIEMFAAQIETTLTNINALDWTGKVDEVLNCWSASLPCSINSRKASPKR